MTIDSPWKRAPDSPSKQLLLELRNQTVEFNRVIHTRLDDEALQRDTIHRLALAAAAAEHEAVRARAERAQRLIQLEQEAARRKHDTEELRRLEECQREVEEARVRAEVAKARYKERQAQEEARALQEAKSSDKTTEHAVVSTQPTSSPAVTSQTLASLDETVQNKPTNEITSNTIEVPKAIPPITPVKANNIPTTIQPTRELQATPLPPTSVSSPRSTSKLVSSATVREVIHQQYLDLHQRLKELRRSFTERAKADKDLKDKMGLRHEIRKSLGQLTTTKGANKVPISTIVKVLRKAASFTQPSVDVRPYIIMPLPRTVDSSNSQVSGLLIYLLIMLSKLVVAQFVDEASVTPQAADPAGIAAITIFAQNEFQWQGVPLIDILIAKYHVVCPVLFGIYGSDKMEGGRKRLGWRQGLTEQQHNARMTGLGAGFAALALRDFRKSKRANPYPSGHYWRALACIVNMPSEEITETHCIVLKAMVENHASTFIDLYGQAAVVALRKAVSEYPRRAPKSVPAQALSILPEKFRKELHLQL